jgi:hypothetical protein
MIAPAIIGCVVNAVIGCVARTAYTLKVSTIISVVDAWKVNAVIVKIVMNGITSMVLRATLALNATLMVLII